MYSLISVFTGSFMSRIYELHDHPNNWIISLATLFCIVPHIFTIYTLHRYKYTDNPTYASIREYALISIVIIIGWIVFSISSILDIHTLEFDFILAMCPLHMTYVLLMVQPDFFRRFAGSFRPFITRTILGVAVATFVCLCGILDVNHWLTIRPLWYATYISICFSTVTSFFLLPVYIRQFTMGTFFKVLWCGGFPRFQVAIIHIIMWELVSFLLYCAQCHYGISIFVGLLTGWVQLLYMLFRNKYFRRSAGHWNRRRRLSSEHYFSRDFHCRSQLEIWHLYGMHMSSRDTVDVWDL